MPLYDFKCPFCGSIREVLIRANTPVPVCVHPVGAIDRVVYPMKRLPSAPGVLHVKGFSAINNYARTETGWQASEHAGIRTRVTDGGRSETEE